MPREITRAGRRSPWKRLQTSCLIYVRRGERKGNEERKSQPRGNGEMESKSETESTGRLLNIIFSTRENFSLFRSPTIVAVVFQEDRHGTTGGERSFPFLRFRSYVPTACSRGARRAASLLVLVVCQPRREISLKAPSFLHSFFSSSSRCRRLSRRRWEAYAMMLVSLAERERRRQKKIRRNLTEDAWVRMPAWNRGDLLLQIRNFSRNQIARRKHEGSTEFSLARYDL